MLNLRALIFSGVFSKTLLCLNSNFYAGSKMSLDRFLAFLHSRVIPTFLDRQLERKVFREMVDDTKVALLLKNTVGNRISFCLVHWNAPEFLLLNIKQILNLYPDSKIYVLDNGSKRQVLDILKGKLAKIGNVSLFSASPQYPGWALRIGSARGFYPHAVALQLLLNFAAEASDEVAVFLDQDCILADGIDDLIAKLNSETLLVGVRDYVVIPKDYEYLKKGKLRNYHDVVHASFMIVHPQLIRRVYGKYSFFSKRGVYEPYHGLSMNMLGKILFLETKMHPQIPFLTIYTYNDKSYALHAWYSSRTIELSPNSTLDGYPVSWLKEANKTAFVYMQKTVQETPKASLKPA
jgi:glycosyltransferase involved in cell wall biosynthesis